MSGNPFLDMAGIDAASVPTPPVPSPQPGGYGDLASAAEQRYGLPPGLMSGLIHVESRGNPHAVSPAGAVGITQLMPATARALGVDPTDPAQAIDGSGRLMRQNLDAAQGDVPTALKLYHAGPNTRLWGPKTQAYPGQVLAAMGQPSGDASAPAAPATPAPPASNPFLDMAGDAATGAPSSGALKPYRATDAKGSSVTFQLPADTPDDQVLAAAAKATGRQDYLKGNVQHGPPDQLPAPADAPKPAAPAAAPSPLEGNMLGVAGAAGLGVARGLSDISETGARAVEWGARKLGYNGYADKTEQRIKGLDDFLSNASDATGNPVAYGGGEIAGNVVGTDGLGGGVGLASRIPALARAVRGVAAAGEEASFPALAFAKAVRGVDLASQGVYGGVLASRGQDVRTNALLGAVAAPVVGGVVGKVAEKVAGSRLAQLVRGAGKNALSALIEAPSMDARLGTAGARSGIDATTTMPAAVDAHVQQLVQDGASPAEAQAHADMAYVGAKPTVANVTRSRTDWHALGEGSKVQSTDGQALAGRIAENNAALHDTLRSTVQAYGGVPADGEAAQTAASALASASDTERAHVSTLYDAARAKDGDVRVDVPELRQVLSDPMNKAAVTNEGAAFVGGMSKRTGILNPNVPTAPRSGLWGVVDRIKQAAGMDLGSSPKGMTASELEQLRKAANDAYDRTGANGERNALIGQVKGAVDTAFDRMGDQSAAYGQARAAHKAWATKYQDPEGIANLIDRDTKGNFTSADNWRKAEGGLIGGLSDQQFVQVVGQLKANGQTGALNRLKASIVQDAYERGSNSARDELGNPTVSGKLFQDKLNKIGMPKLQALFSPDEIGHLATVGRAARALNEAVPGTVNTSGTASTLINALAKAKSGGPTLGTKGKVLAHLVAAATHPVVGNIAVHAGNEALAKAGNTRAARAVNASLREFMDPNAARLAAKLREGRAAASAQGKALGAMVARRAAPVLTDRARD